MRIVVTLLVIIAVLAWAGFEMRARDRGISNVLFGFSGLFALMLLGAFFGVV